MSYTVNQAHYMSNRITFISVHTHTQPFADL